MKQLLKALPLSLFLIASSASAEEVSIGVERQTIPTYAIGAPEVDPIFFTGRVYQGAEGYIYPYALYDVLTDKKEDKDYSVLRLKNQYVDIGVLPEIGGRIFQATDLTNDHHFFYTQTGIKPSLIGMLGAWLSGGVEWNIPDHHRPSTYMPVSWTIAENPDGSRTAWVGETELRHRLKWSVGVSVYPERSWVEARVMVINPTPMIQSMLYWANVSVHCNDDYQVIFPPDVEVGVDHHKVYFTPWPEGPVTPGSDRNIDLSMWKNFTEGSRSIFAWDSKMDFLAGYDHGKDVGTVHVANRHQVPGKKFFLWGNNPNGHMWNKILSDNDGHYLELMVGAFSDNQPDYSWLAPGEIREFSQIWYPIKGIKGVMNATVEGAVNFRPDGDGRYLVGYHSTTARKNARVVVKHKDEVLMDKTIDIDPDNFFLDTVDVPDVPAWELYTALLDADGDILVDYTPVRPRNEELPPVIDGTKPVDQYETNEELYIAGLRVDQFNNARLKYMDFYNEALRRDSMDARVNIEVAKHYIRQAEYDKARKHLNRALARLQHDYTRAYDNEANYYLGYISRLTGDRIAAEENLWAATYTPAFKHPAYYQLALTATVDGNYAEALHLVNESLLTGAHDIQALTLKAYLLRKLGRKAEAEATIAAVRAIDPLDYMTMFEESMLQSGGEASFPADRRAEGSRGMMAVQELLEVVNNYLNFGDNEGALQVLDAATAYGAPYIEFPLVEYYRAFALLPTDKAGAEAAVDRAGKLDVNGNFPLRIEEVPMFDALIALSPDNDRLHYLRGNLLYYLGQKDAGLSDWYEAVRLNPSNAIACRNVGFAEGVNGNLEASIKYYDMAIKANPKDALLLTESDKICERAGMPAVERLRRLQRNMPTVMSHDDAVMRLLTLYNETGQYDKASAIMDKRHFHLWEGGGEIHGIYVNSHLLSGMTNLKKKKYVKAIEEFELAKLFPTNLEVAPAASRNYVAQADYLEGVAYEDLGQAEKAREAFSRSADAKVRPNSDQKYYQILSLRKLGKDSEATAELDAMTKALDRMRANTVDNYAKFGDGNLNAMQSRTLYFSGLVQALKGDSTQAQADFREAVRLYPGNVWAQWMSKEKPF